MGLDRDRSAGKHRWEVRAVERRTTTKFYEQLGK